MDEKQIKEFIDSLQLGYIYFISYGGNTQLIGRILCVNTTDINYLSQLHYWNGHESFYYAARNNCYSVKSGITEIRRATKAEKHALIKFEIEHETC